MNSRARRDDIVGCYPLEIKEVEEDEEVEDKSQLELFQGDSLQLAFD